MELTIFSNIMIFWGDDISLAKFQYRPALVLLKQYKFKLFIENVSLFNEGSVSFWFSQYILSKDISLAKKERYQYEELINLLIDLVIYVLFVYLFSIRKCITLDVMMHE